MKKIQTLGYKYTHFALIGSTIYDGWEYKNLDKESIKEYTKEDLRNNFPDTNVKSFKIMTRKQVIAKNIIIEDTNNWVKYN